MIKFIADVIYEFFEWPEKSRLEKEIWYNERALRRYRFFLTDYAGNYEFRRYYEEKIVRVEAQLKWLKRRRRVRR